MSKGHLNYIILHDGSMYYLFERLGKNVPFEAYNRNRAIYVADNVDEILAFSRIEKPENFGFPNSKSSGSPRIEKPENLGSADSKSSGSLRINFSQNLRPRSYEIEHSPYEVIFNEEEGTF